MVPSPNCAPLRGPVPTQRQEQLCLTRTKPSHVAVGAAITQGGENVTFWLGLSSRLQQLQESFMMAQGIQPIPAEGGSGPYRFLAVSEGLLQLFIFF